MPDNLELIIKDLYELDPTLRSEDKAVRAVVASLLAKKPLIRPDQAFVADLRAKLLVAHSTKQVVEGPILSSWFMYLAPVGVVAVLLFMMVPKPLSHQAIPPIVNEAKELDSTFSPQMDSTDEAANFKNTFIAPEVTPAGGDIRTMMTAPQEESGETFAISTQLPGQLIKVDFAYFNEPTFLVIQKDRQGNPGEVVGVSKVLSGQMEGIEIALMQKMFKDETFFATAYRDNDDGIYTPGKDSLVYDTSGTLPLQQMFSVSPF